MCSACHVPMCHGAPIWLECQCVMVMVHLLNLKTSYIVLRATCALAKCIKPASRPRSVQALRCLKHMQSLMHECKSRNAAHTIRRVQLSTISRNSPKARRPTAPKKSGWGAVSAISACNCMSSSQRPSQCWNAKRRAVEAMLVEANGMAMASCRERAPFTFRLWAGHSDLRQRAARPCCYPPIPDCVVLECARYFPFPASQP